MAVSDIYPVWGLGTFFYRDSVIVFALLAFVIFFITLDFYRAYLIEVLV